MNENDIFAFPRSTGSASDGGDGMTLRDWFAGQVAGELSRRTFFYEGQNQFLDPASIALKSYNIAEAMLKIRQND